MDDKKKRRTRRKRKPTKEEIKADKEFVKKSKEQSEKILSVVEQVDETDATQRLLDIQNKVTVIDKDIFQSLYGHWGVMPIKHVERMAKDDNITVFERMTAARAVLSMKPETTNGMKIGQYIEERYAGKAVQKVEHSGPDGGAINIQKQAQDEIAKFDEFLDQMTDEELEEYEKVLEFEKKMKAKHEDETES